MSSCSNHEETNSGNASQEEMPFSAVTVENVNPRDEQYDSEEDPESSLSIDISRENAITRAVEKASESVVTIMSTQSVPEVESLHEEYMRFFFGGQIPRDNTSMGSGFVISEDGLVVTNQHVVGGSPSEITVTTTDGSMFNARLIGFDELTDIALLKIESDEPFQYINLTESDDVIVGEWAIALGNPFGLFEDGRPTATVGVISAKNRDFTPDPNNRRVYIDMIQTDAAINRGNSGGPLLNSNGDVIGMNTFIYTGGTSAGFVGLSFAIPSSRIDRVISHLLTSGVVMLD